MRVNFMVMRNLDTMGRLSEMLSRTLIILHSVHSFGSMEEINLEVVQQVYRRMSNRFLLKH